MERSQRKSTLKCIQFLLEDKLGGEIFLKEEKRLILDLECGSGFSSQVLVDNGFKVVGIDILPDMILLANLKKKESREQDKFDLMLADIRKLPFKVNLFDGIISVSAYNFIITEKMNESQKIRVLNNTAKNLNKLLKKNGKIVIEFYPSNDKDLKKFCSSFINNGFDGYVVKRRPRQKTGQTFLLMRKIH